MKLYLFMGLVIVVLAFAEAYSQLVVLRSVCGT